MNKFMTKYNNSAHPKRAVVVQTQLFSWSVKNAQNEFIFILYLLIKMGFGNGEEGAVTVSTHTEDKRFPREHRQLTHQLSGVSHKQT